MKCIQNVGQNTIRKRIIRRPRRKWKNTTTMDVRKPDSEVGWQMDLVQYRVQWRDSRLAGFKIRFTRCFIYDILNGCVKCMVEWAMNVELGRMWKEAVVAYFKALHGIRLERLRETRKPSVKLVGVSAKIRTGYLPNKSHMHYPLIHLPRSDFYYYEFRWNLSTKQIFRKCRAISTGNIRR
jgi:hypothetical protein